MKKIDTEQILESVRRPLVLFGVLIVGVGGFLLLYLGVMVFQVINNPEKVKIVEFVLRHIQIDDKAIFGSLNHKPFEIYFSKSFRTVLFVLSGVFMIWVLAGIVKALISGGIKIIKLALVTTRTGDDDRQSNSLSKPVP
jgi:hypothetical protein